MNIHTPRFHTSSTATGLPHIKEIENFHVQVFSQSVTYT